MCFDFLPLIFRVPIAQTYVALTQQEAVGSAPRLSDCQRIAAFFGKTLPVPLSPAAEHLERAVQQLVERDAPFLFPLFLQLHFVNLLSSNGGRWSFESFKKCLNELDWDKSLLCQLSAQKIAETTDLKRIVDIRSFLFQAIVEIRRKTAGFPPEKQQKCLTSFLFFCMGNRSDTAELFASFGTLEDSHQRLSEEEFICFTLDYVRKTRRYEEACRWVRESPLSDEHRVEIALLFVDQLQENWQEECLPYLGFNAAQSFLFLKQYMERWKEIWGWCASLEKFPLEESQRIALAWLYAEHRDMSSFCYEEEKFPHLDGKTHAEMIMRFVTRPTEAVSVIRLLHLSDPDLLWKIFLAGISHNLDFLLYWEKNLKSDPCDPLRQAFFEMIKHLEVNIPRAHCYPEWKFKDFLCSVREQEFFKQWGGEALEPHFQIIEAKSEEEGKIHSFTSVFWLLRLFGGCIAFDLSLPEVLDHPFVESAWNHRDPRMRETLIRKILFFLSNENQKKYVEKCLAFKTSKKNPFPKHALLPLLFLSHLSEVTGAFSKELCDSLVAMSRDRVFKEAQNLKALIAALALISEEKDWSQEDKKHLLELIAEKGKEKERTAMIPLLRAIPALHSLSGFHPLTRENLLLLNQTIEELLINAVLKKIPIKQIDLFREFHVELNEMFRIDKALWIYAGVLARSYAGQPPMEVFASFVDLLLLDLKDPKGEHYRKKRYALENNMHLQELFSQRQELFTQWQENQSFPLKTFIETHCPDCAQGTDLSVYEGWTIEITDNPVDLFLCGTEIETCQHITKELSSGLLDYCLGGEIKILEIKNRDKQVVARHIFRMLLDQNKNPVLFMEMLYQRAGLPPKLAAGSLEKLAKLRAKELQVPLTCTWGDGALYGQELYTEVTPLSRECKYTDAGRFSPDGSFTVSNAKLVL